MYEKNETAQKVMSIIADALNVDKTSLTPQSSFQELGADSLDRLEMIMKIEEIFGIEITDEQETSIKTVQDAIDVVHELRNK